MVDDLGLALRCRIETSTRVGSVTLFGEPEEEREVPRFGSHERAVEVGELVFETLEPLRQELEALTRARFDQRSDEQPVEKHGCFAVIFPHSRTQGVDVFVFDRTRHRAAAGYDVLVHLPEVLRLLAREVRERLDQTSIVGAEATDQRQSALGGLQLAVGVVGQEPVQVLAYGSDPVGRGGLKEMKHLPENEACEPQRAIPSAFR